MRLLIFSGLIKYRNEFLECFLQCTVKYFDSVLRCLRAFVHSCFQRLPQITVRWY